MKNLFLFAIAFILVLAGCQKEEETSGGSSPTVPDHPKQVVEGKRSWWESENSKLKREIEQYKRQIDHLEAQLKSAQKEKAKAEEDRDAALAGKKKSDLLLGIVFGTIGCVIFTVFIWIGKLLLLRPVKVTTSEVLDSCPRCGMKRTPGESICRECGTHF